MGVGLLPYVIAGAIVAWVGVPAGFAARGLIAAHGRAHDPFMQLAFAVARPLATMAPVLYAALGGALAARLPHGLRWPGRALMGIAIGALAWAFILSWQPEHGQRLWDRETGTWIGPGSALGALIGALWGAPWFDEVARSAPFRWFSPAMARAPWPARFFILVPVATLTFVAGVSAAVAFVLLLCALLTLAVLVQMILRWDSPTSTYVGRRRSKEPEPESDNRPIISMPPGARVNADGRIVERDGWFSERPTGFRVGADGRVVREGLLFDEPTGVKFDAEGRIVEEGLLFDRQTGARLRDGEFVREGVIFDDASGVGLDDHGRVVAKGLLRDTEAGVEVFRDGRVRRRGGDGS